jgi:hypothetical protein
MGILNEISGNRVYLDTSSFIFYVEVLIRAFQQALQNKTYFQVASITRAMWESAAGNRSRQGLRHPPILRRPDGLVLHAHNPERLGT